MKLLTKKTIIIKDIAEYSPTIINAIFRRTNITLSHILETINEMETEKMITKKTIGRTTQITITKKGIQISDAIKLIETITK